MTDVPAGDHDEASETEPGGAVISATFAATGVLFAAAVAGVLVPDGLGVVAAVVSGIEFAVGTAAMLWAYAVGIGRSRTESVTLGGLFFASDGVQPRARFRLRIAFGAQCLIALAAAIARPYTAVAFVVLAPMAGLGAMAAYSARHARFPPRESR